MTEIFNLFFIFFVIGLFTFGGGYAMIPLIQKLLVPTYISEEGLFDFLAISESTPGPFAVNIATFIGCESNGILGGIVATVGVVLPSVIVILVIFKVYSKVSGNTYVEAALGGIRPAVIALILSVAVSLCMTVCYTDEAGIDLYSLIIIVAACAVKLIFKKIHPIAVIGVCALLGLLFYGVIPQFI